jgi:hypothetical protein
MTRLDIERTVWCPNPKYGGNQSVSDCEACECFGEIEPCGNRMICHYMGANDDTKRM